VEREEKVRGRVERRGESRKERMRIEEER